MSERKPGWYWVKPKNGEWTPCEWLPDENYPDDSECWVDAPISPIGYASDAAFEDIGPRIPTPDEPWQCVPVEATQGMLMEVATSDGATDEEEIGYGLAIAAWDWHLMLSKAPKPE